MTQSFNDWFFGNALDSDFGKTRQQSTSTRPEDVEVDELDEPPRDEVHDAIWGNQVFKYL